MRTFLSALFLGLVALVYATPTLAQNKPPQCLDTCEPDSTSASYAPTFLARPQTKNARARTGVLSGKAEGASSQSAVLAGSASYNYAIPIVSLPGRSGLDLNLVLYYNSAVWTVDTVNGTATFNADRDFPSYGFRLGFGLIEAQPAGSASYLLTEPDGTKRQLVLSSGTIFVTVDSSYIDWNTSNLLLRRKDGTQWTYQLVPSTTTFYRPIKIEDTNGNYISILYSTATGADKQAIDSITDTLGRTLKFNYSSNLLSSILLSAPSPSSATRTVAYFGWSTEPLNYNFGSGLTVTSDTPAKNATINILTSCAYPNATTPTAAGAGYTFTYGDWGIVDKISQTGASGTVRSYVRYDYPSATTALSDHPTFQHQFVSSDGTSSTEASWTVQVSEVSGVTSSSMITDPFGTVTTTNLFTSGWQTGLVSSVTIANGTTIYRTTSTSWTQDNTSLTTPLNPRPTAVFTTLNDSGQQSSVTFGYDSNGNVTDVGEYDYGGALIRQTHTDFLSTSPYINAHILDRPDAIRVADSVNNPKSQVAYTYDVYSPGLTTVTSAPQHDDSPYGAGFTTRGNVTSVTRYKNPSVTAPSGGITRNYTFDTLGNLLTAQLDCCQQKTWSFSSATGYAYPDSTTRGGGTTTLTIHNTYDPLTGLAVTRTDENNQQLSLSYDALERPYSLTGPLGTSIGFSYDDISSQPAVTKTVATDTGKSIVQITTSDGLGRPIKQQTQDAAGQNVSIVETQYDAVSRVAQTSNPHASGATPLWTANVYDPLNRVTKIIPTDGSSTSNNSQIAYSGSATTFTDPAGKQRRTFADAAGRTIEVDEPGGGNASPGTGSFVINGTIQQFCSEPAPPPKTCGGYTNDRGTVQVTIGTFSVSVSYGLIHNTSATIASALTTLLNGTGSPVTASVSGSTISFTANQSSDTTNYTLSSSSTWDTADFVNPSFIAQPSGATMTGGTNTSTLDAPSLEHPMTTVYSYDGLDDVTLVVQGQQQRSFVFDALGRLTNATTPEAGALNYSYSDYGLVLTRTDARNVMASYQYDGLNRPIGTSYTLNGSAWATMPNVCTPSGGSPANVCLAYGTSAGSFNNGRPTQMTDPTGSEAYQYDALGRVTTLTKTVASTAYPISYAYDIVGNPKSITYPSGRVVQQSLDSLERINQISSSGVNYLSSLAYNSAWQPTGFNYGNGVSASFGYNSRMQLSSLAYATLSSTLFSLNYDYSTGVPGNNGQIQRITDNVDSTRTTSMVYDGWLRLKSWTNSQAALTETYDRYGNRLTQNLPVPSNITVDPTTNHVTTSGYSYDAAGNMTNDSINALTYDGENHAITSTQSGVTSTYSYDGNGLRVQKISGSTTTVYIFSGSKVIAEYDNGAYPTTPSREHIFSGGSRIAQLKYNPDLISNGGFEQGLQGWSANGTGISAQLVTNASECHSGSNCVELTNSSGGDPNYSNSQQIPVTVGQTISWGGWTYHVAGVHSYARWVMGVWAVNGSTGGLAAEEEPPDNFTLGTWIYQSGTYTVPSWMECPCHANIWVDFLSGSELNDARFDDGYMSIGPVGPTPTYYHPDHLSDRLVTDSSGNTLEQLGHYPFGEAWYNSSNDKFLFTTYERDSESGNDYAMARTYVNRLARFSSPDPLPGSSHNPQRLNRYAYAYNDPANLADPLGLCPPGTICVDAWGSYWPDGGGGGGGGIFNRSAKPAPNDGGGGGVNLLILDKCTISLYGVMSLIFVPSAPGANGHFDGINLFAADPLQPAFTVVNDVSKTMQQMYDEGARIKAPQSGVARAFAMGYVDPQNPYLNYTAKDTFTMAPPSLPLYTQLTELGNSLQLITTPQSVQAMIDRDQTLVNTDPGQIANSAPGSDLANCVFNGGPRH